MDQRFGKSEHLKSRKIISEVFKSGKTIKGFPLLALYIDQQQVQGVQVAFSVPKKKFKRAVDRNLHKRWMREAYRKNRHSSQINELGGVALVLIYVSAERGDYQTIEKSMQKILARFYAVNSSPDKQSERI